LGLSTQPAVIYDKTLVDGLGITGIKPDWTLAQFRATCMEIGKGLAKSTGKDAYGSDDMGGQIPAFEAFVRSKGKQVFAAAGGLGFDKADLTEWYEFWDKARLDGVCGVWDKARPSGRGYPAAGGRAGRIRSQSAYPRHRRHRDGGFGQRPAGLPVADQARPQLQPMAALLREDRTHRAGDAGRVDGDLGEVGAKGAGGSTAELPGQRQGGNRRNGHCARRPGFRQ